MANKPLISEQELQELQQLKNEQRGNEQQAQAQKRDSEISDTALISLTYKRFMEEAYRYPAIAAQLGIHPQRFRTFAPVFSFEINTPMLYSLGLSGRSSYDDIVFCISAQGALYYKLTKSSSPTKGISYAHKWEKSRIDEAVPVYGVQDRGISSSFLSAIKKLCISNGVHRTQNEIDENIKNHFMNLLKNTK